jgi:hypothetical protein
VIELSAPIWARRIRAKRETVGGKVVADRALASGFAVVDAETDVVVIGEEPSDPSSAPMQTLESKKRGFDLPHIAFANAVTDEALLDFVRAFGPVRAYRLTSSVRSRTGEAAKKEHAVAAVEARERFSDLRREQRVFRAAAHLFGNLSAAPIETLMRNVAEIALDWRLPVQPQGWTEQSDAAAEGNVREAALRVMERLGIQRRRFAGTKPEAREVLDEVAKRAVKLKPKAAEQLREAAVGVAMAISAAFAPRLRPVLIGGRRTFSRAPSIERTGVRRALYGLLIEAFERGSRGEAAALAVCARGPSPRRPACGTVFLVDRRGSRFCSRGCGLAANSRTYLLRKGYARRRKHAKKKPAPSHPWRASVGYATQVKKQRLQSRKARSKRRMK